VLVGEVEDEYVVRLSIDGFLDRVGLVSDEGREESDMAHPGDDVVPVCVFEVEVGFFGEALDVRTMGETRLFFS
jgi:hypothetical protein